MWRATAGVIALIASLVLLIVSSNLPNVFAKPVYRVYKGEAIRDLKIEIPMDGEYEVMLRVSRQEGEDVPRPEPDPLLVAVDRNGAQIGVKRNGGQWSTQEVGFVFHTFEANKGDVVYLSVKPTPTLAKFGSRTVYLAVARVPFEYTAYFMRILALRGLSFMCLGAAVLFFTGYLRKRKLTASR